MHVYVHHFSPPRHHTSPAAVERARQLRAASSAPTAAAHDIEHAVRAHAERQRGLAEKANTLLRNAWSRAEASAISDALGEALTRLGG